MNKTLALALILALGQSISTAHAGDNAFARAAQRIDALNQQHTRPSDLVFAEQMQHEYSTSFSGIDTQEHLRNESDEDLKLHWQAVATAAFYSDSPDLAHASARVFAEMRQRGLTEERATTSIFNSLVRARLFDEASAFRDEHADANLPPLPAFIDKAVQHPSVWVVHPNGNVAEKNEIDLGPLQIIVAAGCHFSADAAKDIADDPVLGPVFAKHAHWLSLPLGSEQLDDLAKWNATHPQAPMLAIHSRSEWSVIPQWNMPTFAIIQDGKLIDSTAGWRSGDAEFRENLMTLLKRAGLVEADAR